MKKSKNIIDRGTLRIVDANFNRAKEGLRVAEDIFRFAISNDSLRKKARRLRHALDPLNREIILQKSILSRCTKEDLGRKTDCLEIKRRNLNSILYANLQRAKEALRVLEETFKLITPKAVPTIKKIRYAIYTLEKEATKAWPPLCDPRHEDNQQR